MDEPTATETQKGPLEAERERLRRQGFSDAEISQILIAREMGNAHGESPAHGIMTGLASNLAAAGAYAKNFIPGLVANLGTIRDSTASATARSEAALAFAFKVIVVVVIGYIMTLEFSQMRSLTMKAHAEACSADMKMIVDTIPPSKWDKAVAEYNTNGPS